MIKESPFAKKEVFLENESAFAIFDGYPVSPGHSLVVPKIEINSIFKLKEIDYLNCFRLVFEVKKYLEKKYDCKDFNIGINNGEIAGQTIEHAHIHVIPRYKNDIKDPRGGVRNILEDKSGYLWVL